MMCMHMHAACSVWKCKLSPEVNRLDVKTTCTCKYTYILEDTGAKIRPIAVLLT